MYTNKNTTKITHKKYILYIYIYICIKKAPNAIS